MAKHQMPRIRLGEREIKILIFLWKWKVASTAALTSRFFPAASPGRAYNRLRDLRRIGLIEMRCDEKFQRAAWMLTKAGFKAIRNMLPALHEEAYRSQNLEHDFLTTAFHLGDWLNGSPEGVALFTEQQLRCVSSEDYPKWVPQIGHRADGYTQIKEGDRVRAIAIETELHRKVSSSYEDVAFFYEEADTVFRVLWLVPTLSMARYIQRHLSLGRSVASSKHNFVTLDDFQKLGWLAPFGIGPEKGMTVTEFLCGKGRNIPDESGRKPTTALLLDARRSYVKSKASVSSPPTPEIQLYPA